MAEIIQSCPQCGCPDVTVTKGAIYTTAGADTHCPLCGWAGLTSELVNVVGIKEFWTIEKVGNYLLSVTLTKFAGPLVLALRHVGLLPDQMSGDELGPELRAKHNKLVGEMTGSILKAAFEAMLEASFTEAETQHRKYVATMGGELHDLLKPESKDKKFEFVADTKIKEGN